MRGVKTNGAISTASRPEPVVDLFLCLAAELKDMADAVEQVSLPLDDMQGSGISSRDRSFVNAMQGLDLTRQRLDCLAQFLTELAPSLPSHWTIDLDRAAEVVTLSDLARRLRSPGRTPSEIEDDAADGDFELF